MMDLKSIVVNPERTTSLDYRNPNRPLFFRGLNSLLSALSSAFGERPLSFDDLLESAERKEGLSDFGRPDFQEPLKILLSSINKEAGLTPLGRVITRKRLEGVLRNRLRAENLFQNDSSILDRKLPPVAVITGLQRTGTTLLHRLLNADGDTRCLLSWEALNPAPFLNPWDGRPVSVLPGKEDPRITSARVSETVLAFMAPDFFAVHPVEAEAPEEDVLLLDMAFLSTVPEATLRVPSYSRRLEELEQRPAYEYMKKMLKLLVAQRPGKRWILKTPHHLEYLDTLIDVFPDVKIIWTHRDPMTTLASFCSMIAHGRGVFSDAVDPIEIGRDWCRKVLRMLERAMKVRETADQSRFIDVSYEELTRTPLDCAEKIYRFLGTPMTDRIRTGMKNLLENHVKDRYGSHRYGLDYFGLDEGRLRERFSEYYRRYL